MELLIKELKNTEKMKTGWLKLISASGTENRNQG